MEHFAYYTIRIRLPNAPGSEPSGVVEQLSTGEKRAFGNRNELLRLVTGWSGPADNAGQAEAGQS